MTRLGNNYPKLSAFLESSMKSLSGPPPIPAFWFASLWQSPMALGCETGREVIAVQ